MRIESDVATIFRANAGNIGVLPDTVPELLVIFYGEVQSFIERVNKLDRADWSAINVELRQLVVNNMVKDQAHIDDLAMELHKQLSAVNDSIFEWPSSSPKKLSPGQIASLAQILEKADVDPLHLRMWLDSNLTPEEIATRASAHNR